MIDTEYIKSDLEHALANEDLYEEGFAPTWLKQAVWGAVENQIDSASLLNMIEGIAERTHIDLAPIKSAILDILIHEPIKYELRQKMTKEVEEHVLLLLDQKAKELAILVKGGELKEEAALEILSEAFEIGPDLHPTIINNYFLRALSDG